MYQVGEGVEFRGCIEAAFNFLSDKEFPQFNEPLSERQNLRIPAHAVGPSLLHFLFCLSVCVRV